jgi:hypothetical protein
MASGRPDLRWAAKAAAATAFCLAGAVAGAGLYGGDLAYIKANAPSTSLFVRLPVQPLPFGYRRPLGTTAVSATSLGPEAAQVLDKRVAAGEAVTGYTLRSAFSSSVPLCLAPATTGSKAGQDGDEVEATACVPHALSQVWIPAQYEANGSRYTWLVNSQYPSLCLSADNSGGGVHQESRVDLWDCYPPPPSASPDGFNEFWDFGTWLRAIRSGAMSYPLFLGSSNFCLDADSNSLEGGGETASVSVIHHYTVPWEYWY